MPLASCLLDNLNPEQLAAVTLPHASALILAGAGSGKTRVLTTRIAWLLATGQARPLSILARHVHQQGGEGDAAAPVGADAGQHPRHVDRHVPRPVQPDAARALPRCEPAAAVPDPRHAGPARADQAACTARTNIDDERFPPRELQWFIAAAKEEGLRPNAVEAGDDFTRRQVEHYALYEAMCQREGVVDFAELLLRATSCSTTHEGIREHYRRRFSHLLVDEFQDTNVLQYRWLRLLAGPHTAVFAVGDDDQSIYAFRGANVAQHAAFRARFRAAERRCA